MACHYEQIEVGDNGVVKRSETLIALTEEVPGPAEGPAPVLRRLFVRR